MIIGDYIIIQPFHVKMTHRLMPGEVLTLNNRRCLHGRSAITLNGGIRLFEVSWLFHSASIARCM